MRVILVGKTGLDGALRLDPQLELLRVPTPLEAVAEAASPLDATAANLVIVGPDAEKAMAARANGTGPSGPVNEFLKGLRAADPGIVVLGIGRNGDAQRTPFDGVLSPDLPGEELRRQVRGRARMVSPTTNSTAPEAARAGGAGTDIDLGRIPADPMAGGADAGVESGTADIGDLTLVQHLIRGRDILPAALALVRARTGDDTTEFIAYTPQAARSPHADDKPVVWEGQTLGHLRAATADKAMLELQAKWLASWLWLRDQQSQLRAAAFTDPLTGAYNRRYFDRFLESAFQQAREARRSVTILLFDIDNFKQYNDKYGHDAGDEILRETVKLMRSTIRPTDRVCRIGGDEFAVIFYEPEGPRQGGSRHPSSVLSIAERFQQQVQQHKFPKLAGMAPGSLTISGGLATYPWDGATPDALLRCADQQALASKRAGKNAITFGPLGDAEADSEKTE